ncbi:alpha/beta hydrolase [Undibacterium sp.]|jgi:pimeloyl-ACP methyl ester carboxylesterase|uniref:esterase/lipase family protein n=1 Tax=Undibacterium sp. TaxID=1914977 RepID=UPI002BA6F459|nr:alpha/beta hydrolase [Undibacterium sp.]HTD06598.1 alpha/beta hydrolase [Undibacterium sp.]
MRILYVHGMGRSPVSGFPIRIRLQQHGHVFDSFHYSVALESFDAIRRRLSKKLQVIAAGGEYAVLGHSLGGVLLRAAIVTLPEGTRLPRRLFLLGSPTSPSRLARRLQKFFVYRLFTGDCGQLLASEERMRAIPAASVPTTVMIGNRGIKGRLSPFGDEDNDCIVSFSEVQVDGADDIVHIPVVHAWQPSSWQVADLLLERISEMESASLPAKPVTKR